MSSIKVRMYGIATEVKQEFMDKPYFTYGFPFPAKDDDHAKQMVLDTIAQGVNGVDRENYSLVCFGEFYPERKRVPFVMFRAPDVVANISEFVTDDFLENIVQKDGDSSDEEKNI